MSLNTIIVFSGIFFHIIKLSEQKGGIIIKKLISVLLSVTLMLLISCNATSTDDIWVISREDGSGTRGAFVELLDIYKTNSSGQSVDAITDYAEITNSTAVMMTTVAASKNAIGYISLGSLNDTVTAVEIDGIAPSSTNIKNGSYKLMRSFNLVTFDNISPQAQDFISFILSDEGQSVVEQSGYISGNTAHESYSSTVSNGKITIAGSSSVSPVMERLKEAYTAINPGVVIELQQNDSTTGILSTQQGICDIGMSSRLLKQNELDIGLITWEIAKDGIAVIVNNQCQYNSLTGEQVKQIFSGNITAWSQLD